MSDIDIVELLELHGSSCEARKGGRHPRERDRSAMTPSMLHREEKEGR